MIASEPTWPGCHGVRLRSPSDLGLGRHQGRALATVDVRVAKVPAPAGDAVWAVGGPASASALPEADRVAGAMQLQRDGDDGLTLTVTDDRRLRVQAQARRVTVTPPFDGVQAQLVASFGLPLVVEELPSVLVLHAAAAATPDGKTAVVLAGPGGTGKSSALIGLVAAGWLPISEDVCVLQSEESGVRVWPGPPWVRIRHDEPGPAGTDPVFRTREKTAWALGPHQPHGPVPLSGIVLLEAPGGDEARVSFVSAPGAIGALAEHAVWLGDQGQRARRLFGPVASLAARIPVVRVRLPRDPGWVGQLTALVAPVAEGSPFGGVLRSDSEPAG